MTNGSDKHHGSGGKKKGAKKAKPASTPAALKRKTLLPPGLAAPKKG